VNTPGTPPAAFVAAAFAAAAAVAAAYFHGATRINFFSLDVEGAELKVLQTFDWSKVKIDVLMVEAEFLANADKSTSENKVKSELVRRSWWRLTA
jgi:hypothetical protein